MCGSGQMAWRRSSWRGWERQGVAVAWRRDCLAKCLILFFGAAITMAAVATWAIFPVSVSGSRLLVAVLIAACGAGLPLVVHRRLAQRAMPRRWAFVCASGGALSGVFLPWSQRGADP